MSGYLEIDGVVTVFCDRHEKPYWIARFERTLFDPHLRAMAEAAGAPELPEFAWVEVGASSAAERQRVEDGEEEFQRRGVDLPMSTVTLMDGEVVPPDAPEVDMDRAYIKAKLMCRKCPGRKRPRVDLRQENRDVVLEVLHKFGRGPVSMTELAKVANAWTSRRRVDETFMQQAVLALGYHAGH